MARTWGRRMPCEEAEEAARTPGTATLPQAHAEGQVADKEKQEQRNYQKRLLCLREKMHKRRHVHSIRAVVSTYVRKYCSFARSRQGKDILHRSIKKVYASWSAEYKNVPLLDHLANPSVLAGIKKLVNGYIEYYEKKKKKKHKRVRNHHHISKSSSSSSSSSSRPSTSHRRYAWQD